MALSSEVQQDPIERGDMALELFKLQIKNGVFIQIMKKKCKEQNDTGDHDAKEEGEVEEADVVFTLFFQWQSMKSVVSSCPRSRMHVRC